MGQRTNEARIQRAVELFKDGFNCSQSVAGAFADVYGYTEEEMLRIASSFGGGIGRMRLTCGAACGMFILAGLEYGSSKPHDNESKARNYKVVQELAERFKSLNGSLICGELLERAQNKVETDPNPEKRTEQYYVKRPCVKIVEDAARIWVEYLSSPNQ